MSNFVIFKFLFKQHGTRNLVLPMRFLVNQGSRARGVAKAWFNIVWTSTIEEFQIDINEYHEIHKARLHYIQKHMAIFGRELTLTIYIRSIHIIF